MAYKESEDARMEVMEVQKAWSGPHDHGGQRFWMNVTDPQVRPLGTAGSEWIALCGRAWRHHD